MPRRFLKEETTHDWLAAQRSAVLQDLHDDEYNLSTVLEESPPHFCTL